MADRVQLKPEARRSLSDPSRLPEKLVVNGKDYIPNRVLGSGFKGVVWEVTDEFSRRRAAKLTIYEDYRDRSYLLEVALASKLDGNEHFAQFIDAGKAELIPNFLPGQTFIGFIEEYIDGVTLEEFLRSQVPSVSVSFCLAYVNALCNALNAMQTEQLRHDDLHTRNVMIATPPRSDLFAEYRIKIVDTGSLKSLQAPTRKHAGETPLDDHQNFVQHLVTIWNTIYSKKLLSPKDRRFLSEAIPLFRAMLDDDLAVALRNPQQIVRQFELAHTRAALPRAEARLRLATPFEFISAEHIADDRLLVSIFAESCPWLEKVSGRDPCLVTGPRGCGKSTIFRWLSVKAHLHKEDTRDLDSLRIAGFYISCSADLQNRLSWISNEALATTHRKQIVHFFNLIAAREVLQTLSLISRRSDCETVWGLGKAQIHKIHSFIVQQLHNGQHLRLQGVSLLEQLIELVEAEIFATHADMLAGITQRHTTSESFLGDLSSILVENIPFFRQHTITFLVDDFSVHRLPEPVQLILNRVIWERRSSHIFKLSSEKYGAVLLDPSSSTADPARELLLVDIGNEYVALDDADQSSRAFAFATELLDNRLRAAGYESTAEVLIGGSKWPEGSLAKALCAKQQGRHQDQYHGLQTIAQLCSGDISSLLYLYSKIFEAGGVTPKTAIRVKPSVQHEAIKQVSRELLEHVRHYYPFGPEMYEVLNAFGTLVRNILELGRWQRRGGASVPTQCPRIEIDQDRGAVIDELPEREQRLAREIVRRAIFIDMGEGLSRHGNVTTLRWHLRRVYLPAFGAALAKNDAVKQKPDWLQFFLQHPRQACDEVWKRWQKDDNGSGLFDSQMNG